jgi:hypothetical protein
MTIMTETATKNRGRVPWDHRFRELVFFRKQHGHCNVQHYDPKRKVTISLGRWVKHQRKLYRDGKLSSDRVAKLGSIGFSWSGNKADLDWEKNFAKLKKYKQVHGNCLVPSRNYPDETFAQWTRVLRTKHRNGMIRDDHKAKLGEIGFEWETPNTAAIRGDQTWHSRYKDLKQYYKEVGSYQGLNEAAAKNTPLEPMVKWLLAQRMRRYPPEEAKVAYKPLSSEQIHLLEELRFPWKPSLDYDKKWDDKFKRLKRYKIEEGHLWVPGKYEKDPRLGRWASAQRILFNRDTLRSDRRERLDQIGFVWSKWHCGGGTVRNEQWETSYETLCEYRETHGDCLVPYLYDKDRQLAVWVECQRTVYKENRLARDRKRKLDEINFVYAVDISDTAKSKNQQHWEVMFTALDLFKEQFGHCRVPQSDYFEDRELLHWVLSQRISYCKGRILPNRKEMLDSIGFDWSPGRGHWKKRDWSGFRNKSQDHAYSAVAKRVDSLGPTTQH